MDGPQSPRGFRPKPPRTKPLGERRIERDVLPGLRSYPWEPGRDDLSRVAPFETYIVQNGAVLPQAYLADAHLTYWHEQGWQKVDLMVEIGRKVLAIEVKVAIR